MGKRFAARYEGVCQNCRGKIVPGQMIDWENKVSTHVTCPAAPAVSGPSSADVQKNAPIVWATSYRSKPSSQVGNVRRAPKHLRKGPEHVGAPVIVVAQDDRFIREDGLSMGLDDDRGWLTYVYARLATEAETADLLRKESAEREATEARQRAAAEKKAAEEAALAAHKAARETAIAGLVPGGESGFEWATVQDGKMDDLSRWAVESHSLYLLIGKLTNGEPIVVQHSHDFDDDRVAFWSTPAGLELVYSTHLAIVNRDRAYYTPETAREWLAKYRGCVGTEFQTWLEARAVGQVAA